MFRGTFTALVTPFRDGGIDQAALEKLIEAQIAGGVTGVVPVGTTGESPTLNHEERETVVRVSVKSAGSKFTVLAGTGSNSTRDAVRYTQDAEKMGGHGALVVAPYYKKPIQEGLNLHFRTIAEACSIPIMLYNILGAARLIFCRTLSSGWRKTVRILFPSRKQAAVSSVSANYARVCRRNLPS